MRRVFLLFKDKCRIYSYSLKKIKYIQPVGFVRSIFGPLFLLMCDIFFALLTYSHRVSFLLHSFLIMEKRAQRKTFSAQLEHATWDTPFTADRWHQWFLITCNESPIGKVVIKLTGRGRLSQCISGVRHYVVRIRQKLLPTKDDETHRRQWVSQSSVLFSVVNYLLYLYHCTVYNHISGRGGERARNSSAGSDSLFCPCDWTTKQLVSWESWPIWDINLIWSCISTILSL